MAKRVRQRSARAGAQAESAVQFDEAGGRSVMSAPVRRAPERPAAEAVSLFERAMRALQRHEYTAAADAFRGLISNYPREGALCERSLVYVALCERELARQPVEPRTTEERLTAATAALNNGDDDRAAIAGTRGAV